MREQHEFDHPVPREIALEICERVRHPRWYMWLWRWIPLAGCWACYWRNRICLDDPMGCRVINRSYKQKK